MNTAIRIGILSVVMAIYMGWAFRGIEYDVMETGPALLGFFVAFTICTLIAVVIYRMVKQPDTETLSRFAFRVWIVTAALVVIGWLFYYAQDPAAAGEFRGNLIVGGIILAVIVGVLNFVLTLVIDRGIDYLMPKRRRT